MTLNGVRAHIQQVYILVNYIFYIGKKTQNYVYENFTCEMFPKHPVAPNLFIFST